ncbi:Nuclear pore complex protein Nup98-Nup96 [Trichinella pseudospiralis]|uniref:Nuclear pore complex protein Nup98-Nup96 n=1 Tax=Trichinella pseudospiralis TaxID=6337 RepID=A0A0V0YF22_TRIPS|nr:Nuclear pore complex protein Nup98-Nup96 [Trichinella pseudospiralis]
MFGNQPTFGTPGFGTAAGSFNAPFGQQQTTGLFGAPTPATQATGLFGTAPASTGTGLFGSTATTQGSLFGTSMEFLFSVILGTVGTPSIFGQPTAQPAAGTNIFGAPATTSSSLFGSTTTANGTTVKFEPVVGSDTMMRNNIQTAINTKLQCITGMKHYEGKSFEELRVEDYLANRKGPVAATFGFGAPQSNAGSLFSTTPAQVSSAPSLFGNQAKPLFGTSTFGVSQPSTGLFGQTTTTAQQTTNIFGSSLFSSTPATTTSVFSFNAATPTGALFGQTQPQQPQQSIFGQPVLGTTSTATTVGTIFGQTSLFGQPQLQSQPAATQANIFGQTPQTPFGTVPAVAATTAPLFGGNLFGNKTATTTAASLFPTFGTSSLSFPQPTSNTLNTSSFPGVSQQSAGLNTNYVVPIGTDPNVLAAQENLVRSQLQAMANSPYGESPLLKLTESHSELLKSPTDPLQMRKALNLSTLSRVVPEAIMLPPVRSSPRIPTKPIMDRLQASSRQAKACFSLAALVDDLDEELASGSHEGFVPRDRIKKLVLKKRVQCSNTNCTPFLPELSFFDDAKPITSIDSNLSNGSHVEDESTAVSSVSPSSTSKDGKAGSNSSANTTKSTDVLINGTVEVVECVTKGAGQGGTESKVLDNSTTNVDLNDSGTSPKVFNKKSLKITSTRSDYYFAPNLDELTSKMTRSGECIVDRFEVGRRGYGKIVWRGPFNLTNLNLDKLVFFELKEVTVYPDAATKPPIGQGLNRAAIITLERVWPNDKTRQEPIKDAKRLEHLGYEEKLKRACEKMNAKFVSYAATTGSWIFEVKHFSKYGLDDDDSDEAEENGTLPRKLEEKTVEKTEAKDKSPQCKANGICTAASSVVKLGAESQKSFSIHSVNGKMTSEFTAKKKTVRQSSMNKEFLSVDGANGVVAERLKANQSNIIHSSIRLALASSEKLLKGVDCGINPPTLKTGRILMKKEEEKEEEEEEEQVNQLPSLTDLYESSMLMIDEIENGSENEKIEETAISIEANQFDNACVLYEAETTSRFQVEFIPLQKSRILNHLPVELQLEQLSKECRIGWQCSRVSFSLSNNTMSTITRLQMKTKRHDEAFKNVLKLMLKCCFDLSERLDKDSSPFFSPVDAVKLIEAYDEILKDQTKSKCPDVELCRDAVLLCKALWEPRPESDDLRDVIDLQRLSDWLINRGERYIFNHKLNDDFQTFDEIFLLLIKGSIDEAVKLCQSEKCYRLSTLLSQATLTEESRTLLLDQLQAWTLSKVDNFINPKILKLYLLIAGQVTWRRSGNRIIDVLGNVHWLSALAFFLWYYDGGAISVEDALKQYSEFWEQEKFSIPKPSPLYLYNSNEDCKEMDILYHLLMLFLNTKHSLESVLNNSTWSEDPLDYHLSWHLWTILHAVGFTDVSHEQLNALHCAYAVQLEELGLWHWAIFVLSHIADSKTRITAIQKMVAHRGFSADEEVWSFLVKTIGIPEKWLFSSMALRAHAEEDFLSEFKWQLKACNYSMAHQLFTEYIGPKLFLEGKFDELLNIKETLEEHSASISEWHFMGEIYFEGIELLKMDSSKSQVESMMKSSSVTKRKLKKLATKLCFIPSDNILQLQCRTEIALKLLSVFQQLFTDKQLVEMSELLTELPVPDDTILDTAENVAKAAITYLKSAQVYDKE